MASNPNILAGASTSRKQGYGTSAAPVSTALINAGTSVVKNLGDYANTIAGSIASGIEGQAYASAIAPRPESSSRQPAAVSGAHQVVATSSGSGLATARIMPTRLGSSAASAGGGDGAGARNEASSKSKPSAQVLAATSTDDVNGIDSASGPQTRAAERARDEHAIAEFEERSFKQPNDVIIGLTKISPDTLTREMARGESSPIIKTLKANGWSMTVSRKTRSRILVSPTGRCYAPGRRGVVPLASCG